MIPIESIFHLRFIFKIIKCGSGNQIMRRLEYQLKTRNASFLPLYEIPTKNMHRLELRYQLKIKSIEIKLKFKL